MAMAAVVCSKCVSACFFRAFRRRTSSEMVSLSSLCASFFHTGVMRTAASVEGGSAQLATAPGVALVQGASRGLGLEFVKQLLERSAEGRVIATCRDPAGANSLSLLKEQHGERLTVLPLDVTKESTIEAAAKAVSEQHARLDMLINTAGILHVDHLNVQPETSMSKLNPHAMILTYQINAMGPLLVIKHMAALLKAGGGKGTGASAAIVANLSARVGSIGDNQVGGWYSYRASKSALNQLTKTVSLEFARRKDPVVCILLHPGTVDTDLSKPFQRNVPKGQLFTSEYSVQKLLGIIDGVGFKENGKFFAWDGQEIPW
ncbi:hypothetical protein BDL97_12G075700 [Sphagnum fallax]|nr:hypothetical protein BDL97_12G075700 [Sphagnum fallax]